MRPWNQMLGAKVALKDQSIGHEATFHLMVSNIALNLIKALIMHDMLKFKAISDFLPLLFLFNLL